MRSAVWALGLFFTAVVGCSTGSIAVSFIQPGPGDPPGPGQDPTLPSGTTGTHTVVGAGGGSTGCAATGHPCGSSFDCCSGDTCTSGVCLPMMVCAPDGDSCGSDGDCCTGTCSNGTCGAPMCADLGGSCDTASCCDTNNTCESGLCCVPFGGDCGGDSDCCESAPFCSGTCGN